MENQKINYRGTVLTHRPWDLKLLSSITQPYTIICLHLTFVFIITISSILFHCTVFYFTFYFLSHLIQFYMYTFNFSCIYFHISPDTFSCTFQFIFCYSFLYCWRSLGLNLCNAITTLYLLFIWQSVVESNQVHLLK